MNTGKLLIVEDDLNLQALLALELTRRGISCDRVTAAEDALMMLASLDYKGLVTNLTLPGMDGWTLLEMVQRNPQTARLWCVAVTGHHDTAVEATALEAGFSAYFHKPLDITRFATQIQDMLNRSMVQPGRWPNQ